MNNSTLSNGRGLTGEGWAALVGVLGSAVLLAKKLLSSKPPKVEHLTRAEFYAEMLATRERINGTHLALLEKQQAEHVVLLEKLQGNHVAVLQKLEAHHRQVLAGLERQAERVSALERAVARMEVAIGFRL